MLKNKTLGTITLAVVLTASAMTTARANPITNWLFGQGTKSVAEKNGYTCSPKPWYVPMPSYLWYDLTCAKKAS